MHYLEQHKKEGSREALFFCAQRPPARMGLWPRRGVRKMAAENEGVIHRPDQEPTKVIIIDNGEGYPSDHDKVTIVYESTK